MMTPLTEDPWWLPARIFLRRDGAHTVQWRNTEGVRCTHPFYSGTMTTVAAGPRCTTALEELERLAERLPARNPEGFIFHLSRCGSTLVSQMLASLPRHKVLSEPAPLDNILWPEEAAARPDDTRCAELLERTVRVLGRRPEGTEAVFVKCDAWHLLDLPLFRRVFPGVPVAFVYRDPLEIAVSHQKQRGFHMVPGLLDAARLGVTLTDPTAAGFEAFIMQVLARLMEAALTHLPPDALLLNYTGLPAPGLEQLLKHFRVEVSPADLGVMLAAAGFHAKNPGERFTPDSAARQAGASPELRALATAHTVKWYELLERRRSGEKCD